MSRRWYKTIILIIAAMVILVPGMLFVEAVRGQDGKPPDTGQGEAEKAVEKAVLEELKRRDGTILAAVLYDTKVQNIRVSRNGQWAVAEMAPFDAQAEMVLPVEPGLAILRRQGDQWQTTLPQDRQWRGWMEMLPEEVMSDEDIEGWLEVYDATEVLRPEAALGGYKLPWPFGQTHYLSQSTAHDKYGGGVDHFAYDFYTLSGGTVAMWELLAARPGKVHMMKENSPNGCEEISCANYIVLKDESTYPVTYQLYLHLAQNSIPDDLHVGDFVNQGQFIGIVDDTGQSTNHHLHFMVHTTSYSYWGTAVDITFDDVDINGGRPRVTVDQGYCSRPEDVCNSFRSAYVSGNKPDPEPPTGDISNISPGQLITNNILTVTGWGADVSSGFGSAQLMAAARNGSWQVVGQSVSGSPFSITVDLCQAGLPVGPTGLGLRLIDKSGYVAHLTGLRWVTLDFACSPPPVPSTCVPGAGQAALFDEANFQGSCKLFSTGGYVDAASLSPLGGGRASSILLGLGSRATLYNSASFTGRSETFNASDSNLADNRIQNNSVYSLFVRSINDQPFSPQPFWPSAGQVISDTNSVILYWKSSEGNSQHQVELTTPTGVVWTSGWLRDPWWNLADGQMLKEFGNYSWRVRSRVVEASPPLTVVPKYPNIVYLPLLQREGEASINASPWSSPVGFVYKNDADRVNTPVTQATFNQYYSNPPAANESYSAQWTPTGLWKRENTVIPGIDGMYFWHGEKDENGDLNYARAHSGALTTVPIIVTDDNPYLRFRYYYDTEIRTGDITRGTTQFWDQRWVQISINDAPYNPTNQQPFINLFQLNGDPGSEWQESPFIPIPAKAGQVIRLRFYFDTIDGISDGLAPDNYYQGWFVDDVSFFSSGPGICTDANEPDNAPTGATPLSAPYHIVTNAKICPEDVDYYAFNGAAGDRIVINIDAQTLVPASALDSVIELIDSDGKSVLAYNDDDGTGKLDSYLTYQLPRNALYFVRVHNYYLYEGGNNFTYKLMFFQDGIKPQVTWLNLVNTAWISKSSLTLSVQAQDLQSGVDKVEFFMHDSNWNSVSWKSLGQASSSGGNYNLVISPEVVFSTQNNMAVFALVTDKAGNTAASSVWNLRTDYELPSASLSSLVSPQSANIYRLSWTGADTISGLDHFEIQRKVDSGAWENLYSDTLITEHWEVVQPGHTYNYRMVSVDKAGNASAAQLTSTVVPGAATLCTNAPDPGEVDNTFDSASQLLLGETQYKSFCNPVEPTSADIDWISLDVQAGIKYWLVALPEPGSLAAPVLNLYGTNDESPINPEQALAPSQPGGTASLFWVPDFTGTARLKVTNADPAVIGVRYRLSGFIEAGRVYLPMVNR